MRTRNATQPNGLENDASAMPLNLASASCVLELTTWPPKFSGPLVPLPKCQCFCIKAVPRLDNIVQSLVTDKQTDERTDNRRIQCLRRPVWPGLARPADYTIFVRECPSCDFMSHADMCAWLIATGTAASGKLAFQTGSNRFKQTHPTPLFRTIGVLMNKTSLKFWTGLECELIWRSNSDESCAHDRTRLEIDGGRTKCHGEESLLG